LLVAALLVAAPGAALAHLLYIWLPQRVIVARLNWTTTAQAARLDAVCARTRAVLDQTIELQRCSAALRDPARRAWLPERDRAGVFDRLADNFRADRVSLEQMTMDEPGLYAAVGRSNLLACERVTVHCTGDYAALTECLDRLRGLELPLRITRMTWSGETIPLRLVLQIEVPFVPDDALRTTLADAARLEDQHES
jgi:hypothetical protein